ncbi:MAG: BON domain-containing protein [Solirubrobacterales bacterium]|nr:BON domain-containing protein [Solirubrobacterales bacterium]
MPNLASKSARVRVNASQRSGDQPQSVADGVLRSVVAAAGGARQAAPRRAPARQSTRRTTRTAGARAPKTGARSGGKPAAQGARVGGKAAAQGARVGGKAAAQGARAGGKAAAQGARVGGKAAAQGARVGGKAAAQRARVGGKAAARGARAGGDVAGRAALAGGRAAARGARVGGRAAGVGGRAALEATQFGLTVLEVVARIAPRPRHRRRDVALLVLELAAAGATGAAIQYLLDPAEGKRRRRQIRDQALAGARGAARQGVKRARHAGGQAKGAAHEPVSTPGLLDDQTLADRVRTEIFRRAEAPKGAVNVGVVDAVVYLRGEVADPGEIARLVQDAREVPGVLGVENLMHRPGVAAPAGGRA